MNNPNTIILITGKPLVFISAQLLTIPIGLIKIDFKFFTLALLLFFAGSLIVSAQQPDTDIVPLNGFTGDLIITHVPAEHNESTIHIDDRIVLQDGKLKL